jgi:hypothetical protein
VEVRQEYNTEQTRPLPSAAELHTNTLNRTACRASKLKDKKLPA